MTDPTTDGGLGDTFASLIDVDQVRDTILEGTVDMGYASAEVTLDNNNFGVPDLNVAAVSEHSEGWVAGFAIGIQGYDYTGAPGTINLDAFLTGEVSNPGGVDSTALSAGVWIIRDDPGLMFPAAASFNDLFLNVALLPVEDSWIVEENTTNANVSLSTVGDPISIEFTQGQIDAGLTEFYVLSALTGGATGGPGNIVNTFSTTLSLDFDTTELIVASVPLPPAAWLFGAAVAALGALGRRPA